MKHLRCPGHHGRRLFSTAMLIGAIASLPAAPDASAATRDWIAGAPGGVYSDGASWAGGAVPSTADTARFNIPGIYQAVFFDFTGDRSLSELEVLQGRPVFALGAGTVNDPFLLSPTAVTVASGATLAFSGGVELTTFNFDVAGTFEVGDFVPGSSTADKTITINDANVSLQDGALIRLLGGTDATFTGGLNTLINTQSALLVDDSTLHTGTSNTVNSSWGSNGGHFDLDIVNGSTATFNNSTIFMGADDGSVNALVSGGSTVTSNSLNLGAASSFSPGESVLVNVTGAGSTWTQNGASTLTIGSTSASGSSSLILSDQGVFNTGTGLTTINRSGTLNLNTDGTTGGVFNAGGNVFVVGGTVNSVEANGVSSRRLNLAAGTTLTASANAQLVFTGDYEVEDETVSLTDGADWSVTLGLLVGIGTGGVGTVTVDGPGTTLTAGGSLSAVGFSGGSGGLTFSNNASATFTSLLIGASNGGTGSTTVESGADLTVNGGLQIGSLTSDSGSLTVTGSGSTAAQAGNTDLRLGNAQSRPGTINVFDNAVFTTGTGDITIDPSGTLNLNTDGTSGGVFNANGNVNVVGGTINSVQSFFSPNVLNLAAGKTLTASDNAQLVFTGDYRVVNGTTFNITDGADWSLTRHLDIGSTTDGSVVVDGAGSTLAVGGFESTFGFDATGSLTLLNEATATFDSEVSIRTGTANIESGADLILNSGLSVGGNSTLSVTGGGSTVTQNGNRAIFVGTTLGTGTITVSDTAVFTTGTSFMQINANGTLVLDNGGTFNANGNVTVDGGTIDEQAGGDFNLADNLALSVLDDGQVSLTSGFASQGSTININRGGDLTSSTFFNIARNATVTVDGVGSTFTTNTANATLLNWGSFGNENARLIVRNGGAATLNANLNLGFGNNGTQDATIEVQSGGTLVMNGQARVGMGLTGDGTLNVDGAGSTATVTGSNVMNIGDNGAGATGTGTVNLTNGGTLTSPTVNVNTTGVVNLTGGNLVAGTINHTNGGGFSFTGGTLAVDTFNGTLTQDGGTLAPGNSPGTTTITGGYNLTAGSLEIEIGGTIAGTEYDRVEVAGFATLEGTLDVSLINGFTPSLGDSFGFLMASGGFDNSFSTLNLPDLSSQSLDWELNPGGATIFLEVVAALDGDFDADGDIDGADFLTWQRNPTIGLLSDWQANYGTSTPPLSISSTVPEPSAILLLAIMAPMMFGRRKRK